MLPLGRERADGKGMTENSSYWRCLYVLGESSKLCIEMTDDTRLDSDRWIWKA